MTREFLVPILLPADPTVALEAATKQYVDLVGSTISTAFSYQFQTSTTPPTAGSAIRVNNSDQTLATAVYVRYTSSDGVDTHNRLLLTQPGSVFYIQNKTDSTLWQAYTVTGTPVDVPANQYVTLPVAWHSGGSALTANAVMATVLSGGGASGTETLDDLTDVTIVTAADGQVLTYNSGTGQWQNEDPTGGGAVSGTKLTALTEITSGAAMEDYFLIEVVDTDDTAMAASGTNKKLTLAQLVNFLDGGYLVAGTNGKVAESLVVRSVLTTKVELDGALDGRLLLYDSGGTLRISAEGGAAPYIVLAGNGGHIEVGTLGQYRVNGIPIDRGAEAFHGFTFDTTTTAGAADRRLRLNNATPASATVVYVSNTPRSGVDLRTRALAATAGDRLYIQNRQSSGVYRVYEVTGPPTDGTTYTAFPVVHRAGNGTFANDSEIVAGFTAPPITVGTTAPTSPLTNDIWIDTT